MQTNAERPPSLRETQLWMASRIAHPGQRKSAPVEQWIAAPPRGDRRERVAVYVDGYPARAREALEETFPALVHVIGHQATDALVTRYLAAVTLASYNLNDLGAELPQFLRHDCLTETLPFLPDLASLEWNVACAFHAHDASSLDPSRLAQWDDAQWERAVLHFQPSVALVQSAWPIRELWEARDTPTSEIDIDLRDRPDHVLVRRAGYGVRCDSLAPVESRALAALLDGHTLGEVANTLTEAGDDAAHVSAWFARWMQQGLIVDCTAV